jgi:hypothetical protein
VNTTTAGKLCVIDGREYMLSPPTWHDWEWLQNEMRGEFIASCRAEYGGDVPEEQEQRIRAQAFKITVLGPDGASWLDTTNGVARLIYALLKQKHPEVTLADVYQWVVFERKLELKRDAMEVTSASLPKSSGASANGAKKKPRPTTLPTGGGTSGKR